MQEIKIPRFDVNDDNVTITDILFAEGDKVSIDDSIIIAESTKMVREIKSDKSGYIHLMVKCFETKETGDVVAIVCDTKEEYNELVLNINPTNEKKADNCQPEGKVNATAKAIALAKQYNVNIEEIAKNKPDGIVKTSDVEQYVKNGKSAVIHSVSSIPTCINVYDRERVIIIGAGRLSEQVIDILLDDKDKSIVGLVDSYKTEYSSYSFPVFNCDIKAFPNKVDRGLYDTVIIALGGDKNAMSFRKELYTYYKSEGIKFTNAIGDNVNIRRAVKIGENNIIMHNCFVGTGTQIGDDNIISYGSCIGHHNVIGHHNLFAPAFITPGSVKVGNDNIFMTNVKTINYITIGNEVVLPVGYNVVENIPDGVNLLK